MKDKKCYREVIEKDLDRNYLKYLARKEKEGIDMTFMAD